MEVEMAEGKVNASGNGKVYFGHSYVITPLASGTDETVEMIMCGESALADDGTFGMYAGRIPSQVYAAPEMESYAAQGYTPLESLAVLSVERLMKACGGKFPPRTGWFFSTTKGNVSLLDNDGCLSGGELDSRVYLDRSAQRVVDRFSPGSRVTVISNACISGLSAMIVARREILAGHISHAVVIGADMLSRFVTEGFLSFRSVSGSPCRPYDASRDGLTLGEACAAVFLTSDRSLAPSPALLFAGGAITDDANHISGPSRTGDGLAYAMEEALHESGLCADRISFVNMHGTATVYNDEMESKAVHLAGLENCPVNSLKGYFGHTLGASGVLESILSAEQIRRGTVFGTKGFASCGTPMPLHVSPSHLYGRTPVSCLKTASGFGGCNAAAVFVLEEQYDAWVRAGECGGMAPAYSAGVNGVRCMEYARVVLDNGQEPFASYIRGLYRSDGIPNMKFFKMDDLCKCGYMAAQRAFHALAERSGCTWEELRDFIGVRNIAVVLYNASSSLDTDMAHMDIVRKNGHGEASPSVFVYTLPNVVSGEICIRFGIKGENTFFIDSADGAQTGAFAERYARSLVESGRYALVLHGKCEYFRGRCDVDIALSGNLVHLHIDKDNLQ